LHLDAQIRQFRADGNDVAVSFGGQRGQDLSIACHDAAALADAYGTVISRYGLDVLDLDVEGSSAEPSAMRLRAEAVSRLQAGRPDGQPLQVWLTLPVTRSGLDSDGKNSVEAMLAAGVDVAGINIMTMNFGPLENGVSMLAASRQAAEATHQTLQQLYSQAGMPADSAQTWRRIGLTPMIGDNDVRGNTFTLDDAAGLNSFAVEHGVGRLSLWSINRDTGCTIQEEWQRPSSHCSGIDQDTGDFANELSRGFTDSS
jgi:chitinase